jgi:hypothetical protein
MCTPLPKTTKDTGEEKPPEVKDTTTQKEWEKEAVLQNSLETGWMLLWRC